MKKYLFLSCLFLINCTSNNLYVTKGASKLGSPKKFASSYKTVERDQNVTYFVCSYYGKKFHGKTAANGEIFDMNKMTCAHKTLPFDTRLKVTNEDNGKSVVVRVIDRGPFVKGRDLDLSYAAAKKIDLIPYGVKKLKVEFLEGINDK